MKVSMISSSGKKYTKMVPVASWDEKNLPESVRRRQSFKPLFVKESGRSSAKTKSKSILED